MNKNLEIPADRFTEIENYLMNRMSLPEKQDFDVLLAADTVLQEQTKLVELTILGIKEAALTEQFETYYQNIHTKEKQVKKLPTPLWKPLLVAASLLLVLISGGWLFYRQTHQHETLYANYFKPDPGLITAMSSTDNYVFDKAMVDYKMSDYNAAITAWKGLQQQVPTNDTLNYFIGVALLAEQKNKEAITYLQKVIIQQQSYFLQDACWYLGLALIKEKRLEEATDYIKKSNHPEQGTLLQQLQKLK